MADTSNILSDFGINLLEEEIDDVIFQTNEFLTDATFTGSQGPFWWLLRPCLFLFSQVVEYQSSVRILCLAKIGRGTKTGQNHGKIKARTLVLEMPFLASLCIGCKGTILSPNRRRFSHKSFFTNHIFNLSRHKRIMQHFWQYSLCEPISFVKVC